MELQAGDIILLYNPKNIFSGLIRQFTKCPYSHAAIVCQYLSGDKVIVEADTKGVHESGIEERLKGQKYIVKRLVISDYKLKDGKLQSERAFKEVGKKYDWKNLLLCQWLLQWFGWWIGTKDKQKNREEYICSELVADCYEEFFPESWKISPADLDKNIYFVQIYTTR